MFILLKKLNTFSFVFIALFAMAIHAQEETSTAAEETSSGKSYTSSEILSQPGPQDFRITLSPTYRSGEYYFSSSTLGLSAEYGFIENFTMAVSSFYGTSQEDDYKWKGFGDVIVGAKYTLPLQGLLQLGFDLGMSPEDAVWATEESAGNLYTGGSRYIPNLAYEGWVSDNLILGIRTQYTIKNQRTSRSHDGTKRNKKTGSNELSLSPYIEVRSDRWALGFNPTYIHEETGEVRGYNKYDLIPLNSLRLTAYASLPVASGIDLVPSVSHFRSVDPGNYNTLDLSIAGRMLF